MKPIATHRDPDQHDHDRGRNVMARCNKPFFIDIVYLVQRGDDAARVIGGDQLWLLFLNRGSSTFRLSVQK